MECVCLLLRLLCCVSVLTHTKRVFWLTLSCPCGVPNPNSPLQVALIQVAIPRPQFDRSAALSKEILHHVARINNTYGGGENLCTGPLQTALKHPGPVYYIGASGLDAALCTMLSLLRLCCVASVAYAHRKERKRFSVIASVISLVLRRVNDHYGRAARSYAPGGLPPHHLVPRGLQLDAVPVRVAPLRCVCVCLCLYVCVSVCVCV